jgi:hypothetical protein
MLLVMMTSTFTVEPAILIIGFIPAAGIASLNLCDHPNSNACLTGAETHVALH